MGLIVLRPDELARLAQRVDSAAEDLHRAAGRLDRSLAEVSLNRADDQFPMARFQQRSGLVRSRLLRLADATRADAALMAGTAEDGEFADSMSWLGALMALTPTSQSEPAVTSSWSATAAGLVRIQPVQSDRSGPRSESQTGRENPGRVPVSRAGGLFAVAAQPSGEPEARLGAWLGSLRSPQLPAEGPDAVWDRVSDTIGRPSADD